MKMKLVVLGVFLAAFALAPAANAAPIYGTIYNGGLFTLDVTGGNGSTIFDVTYTADFSTFQPAAGEDYVWAVAFKPASTSLMSATGSGPAGWTFDAANGLSAANGCGSGVNEQWACASIGVPGGLPTTGNSYSWNFVLTYVAPANFSLDGASMKAVFSDSLSQTNPTPLMSQEAQEVPEPNSMLLLGVGLLGAGFLRRRK